MKQYLSKKILLILPFALFAVTILLYSSSISDSVYSDANSIHIGSIILFVKDGYTEAPLQNAAVVIPEIGQSFLTDDEGKTETVKVPVIEDSEYKHIISKSWGEITILVYKQGYVDCAIFHVNIWENQTRNGPTVLLFPVTEDVNNQPFTLTEGPGRIWVNELLEKYRPSDLH